MAVIDYGGDQVLILWQVKAGLLNFGCC